MVCLRGWRINNAVRSLAPGLYLLEEGEFNECLLMVKVLVEVALVLLLQPPYLLHLLLEVAILVTPKTIGVRVDKALPVHRCVLQYPRPLPAVVAFDGFRHAQLLV